MKFRLHFMLALICLVFNLKNSYAQLSKFAHYPITNYGYDDFKSPVQIYNCQEFMDGSILFGNPEHIIRFDGIKWSFINTKTDSLSGKVFYDNNFVFNIFKSKNNRYFATREHLFGELKFNDKGVPEFHPIYFNNELSNMWSIYEEDESDQLFFHTRDSLYTYDPQSDNTEAIQLKHDIQFSEIRKVVTSKYGPIFSLTYNKDSLYRSKYGNDRYLIYSSVHERLDSIEVPNHFTGGNIVDVFEVNKKTYVMFENNGIYPLNTKSEYGFTLNNENNDFEKVPKDVVKSKVTDSLVYIATKKNGLLIYDFKGNLVTTFNDQNGIQDNNIHDFLMDRNGNLWLCLDNGISLIELSTPSTVWKQDHGVVGGIESIEIIDSNILLSSRTKGVLNNYIKENKYFFNDNSQMNEAAYDLEICNTSDGKKILVVGYSGIFELDSDFKNAKRILNGVYAWKLFQSQNKINELYVGGEDFFGKIHYRNNTWVYDEILSFDNEIRSIITYNDYIYFGVKGNGVFKWREDENTVKIKNGVDDIRKNSPFYLEEFNNQLYVGYDNGVLLLENETLVPAKIVGDLFEDGFYHFHRLFRSEKGDKLWAIVFYESNDYQKSIVGYFTPNENNDLVWNEFKDPVLVGGVIHDMREQDNVKLFGSSKGLILFDYNKYMKTQRSWDVYISKTIIDDTIVYGNAAFGDFEINLNFGQFVRFEFSSSSFFSGGPIEYRTRIVGYSSSWSSFEKITFKDFEKLPHGDYTVELQGRNAFGKESEITRLKITINPPWYLSTIAYIVYSFIAIGIVFLIAKIATLRIQQKNKQLEALVNERTNEIALQNELLEEQKSEIESKNEDILDSIKYAKRIQDTILPTDSKLESLIGEHFVFFQPKDIVSGDFYWTRKIKNKVILSAIDCTGHGVPGALVSFVGNNALLRVTNEFELTQPAAILDKLRELVVRAFKHQSKLKVRDGMDMALVSIDKESKTLEYAGANNSLYLIRNNELIEYKADKQPIGHFDRSQPFSNHEIKIEKGDCIYLFSDGFVDQFGGKDEESRSQGGKKYKSKNFKNLLLRIHKEPMLNQKKILKDEFFDWKGELEQLDDVCVIGVRL